MKNTGLFSIIGLLFILGCAPSAKKLFNQGKKHFEHAEYEMGAQKFQQAKAKGYSPKECAYYVAESYRRSNRIHDAEKFYKEAVDGNISEEDAYFYYAYSMKSNGNYEGATKRFQEYLKIGTNFDLINRAKAELNNLKLISEIVNRTSYFFVENITELNTPEAEYSPYLFKDKLYFTSSRGADKMHMATMTGFTDLYEFTFDGSSKFSGQAKRLHEALNTEDAHEATCVFTKDGKTMYFSRGNNGSKKGQQDVDIFVSTRAADGTWSVPVMLPFCDPNAWDSCPALSNDGKILYFASNREGGYGGTDIYKVLRDAAGNFGPPVNMGAPINTKGNDMFPYQSPHGAIYFSSDGHPSLGAMDIFEVVKKDGKTAIENMGSPLNSSYDDFAMFYRDTTIGFFTSNRPGGKGDDDIYEFTLRAPITICVLNINSYFTLGDSTVKKSLDLTDVKLISAKGDTVKLYKTNSRGFTADSTFKPGSYKLIGLKSGYLHGLTEFTYDSISKKSLKPGENVFTKTVDVVLVKISDSLVITYNNILYDYDKADIRADAALELNKIVNILKENPEINIELGSHTDERGADKYNQTLAQKRAESAVAYIISQGITKERLSAKGYGEYEPLVKSASTEEDHQKNRRTTFRITNVDNLKVKFINKGDAN